MAYGARLESVLGESPRGFESPILRHVMSRVIVDMLHRVWWSYTLRLRLAPARADSAQSASSATSSWKRLGQL